MISSILAFSPALGLWVLACPIGMGAMMWFMSRSGRSQSNDQSGHEPATLDDLRREHERLGSRIEGLEGERPDPDQSSSTQPVRAA